MSEPTLRLLEEGDVDFLNLMFIETIDWQDGAPRRSLDEAFSEPNLAKYVSGWGRPGDCGVIALSGSGEPLGAAWYRLLAADDPGYGFVSPEVPELGIAVIPAQRGRGLGRSLLQRLVQVARTEGRPALSLSVAEDNLRAIRLYERLGFRQVQFDGNSWTMLLTIDPTFGKV